MFLRLHLTISGSRVGSTGKGASMRVIYLYQTNGPRQVAEARGHFEDGYMQKGESTAWGGNDMSGRGGGLVKDG